MHPMTKAHRGNSILSIVLYGIATCQVAMADQPDKIDSPAGIRTALTSVGAVDDTDAPPDPEDPGLGGGFDAENYFQNILVAKISDCTSGVLKEFVAWAQGQALSIDKTVKEPSSLLAYASLVTPPGVLELSYRFDSTQKRARATLYFYSTDGAQHEPMAIESLLKQYKVANLQDRVRVAIDCK